MPKLKVPTVTKPAKKQLTLHQFQRRPLHTPSPEKGSEAGMEKPNRLLGRFSVSPKKQNGIKRISKSFSDTFGVSEDEEAEPFIGFLLEEVREDYSLVKKSATATPEKPVQEEARPTRARKAKYKGKGKWTASADDSDLDEDIAEETPSPVLEDRDEGGGTITPDNDNASDSSWEEAMSKSARKSARPKIPRQYNFGDDPGPLRKRGVRCMECPACMRKDDCGKCEMCRDKKKFGGPGVKKQACIYRKCHNLIRDLPLKVKSKKHYIPMAGSSPPPPKRLHSDYSAEPRPLQASPLKSKRFSLVPNRGSSKDKPDMHMVQIFWPNDCEEMDVPAYFSSSHSRRLSVCRKCASAGKDKMVRCVVCCHIFHTFCVEGGGTPTNPTSPFTCPSCITCQICCKGETCVQCSQCTKSFHKDCLSCHDSHVSEGTWRCVQCSRCMSCKKTTPGKTSDSLWYDDFKYCSECYHLKEKGNFCPMCGECYSDNDFDSKMVQCGACDCWVHSQCEGMSDDWYEILSVLPEESVEFLCKLCGSEEKRKAWQDQVEQYLQESMTKLLACVPKLAKLSSKLQAIAGQVEKKEFPSVASFHEEITAHIEHVLKKNKTNSAMHRAALAEQGLYLEELEELFPWLEEEEEEEGGATEEKGRGSGDGKSNVGSGKSVPVAMNDRKEVVPAMDLPETMVPAPTQTEWPAVLTHDHCYTASPRPVQPVARKEGEEVSPRPPNSGAGKGASPPSTSTPLRSSARTLKLGARKDGTTCPPRSGGSAAPNTGGQQFDGGGDPRHCMLCPVEGDAASEEAGRLVPCGVDEWVHVNCAVWSAEVYEEHSGILRCVHTAISRGARMRCELCKEPGATVGCCTSTCSANYHFQCARRSNCLFLYNKQVFCSTHREHGEGEEALPEAEVAVARCIFVDTHPDRPGRKIARTLEVSKVAIQTGSIQVHSLGSLVELSENLSKNILLPDKYRSSCEFWDVSCPTSTTTYNLTISAPEDDDWLMAPPKTPPTSPSRPQSPPDNDIGYENVTVGEPLPVLWDSLRSPPPSNKRKAVAARKPRVKAVDLAANVASLVSLVRPGGAGVAVGNDLALSSGTDNHRSVGSVDVQVLNNFTRNSQSVKSLLTQAIPPTTTSSAGTELESTQSVAHEVGDPLPACEWRDPATPIVIASGVDGDSIAMETEVECIADSADMSVTPPMDVVASSEVSGEFSTATAGESNARPSAEDDILKSAMSATLLATSTESNAGSANLITALTSTDFPNLVWTNSDLETNSDLSLVGSQGEEWRGKGAACDEEVEEMETELGSATEMTAVSRSVSATALNSVGNCVSTSASDSVDALNSVGNCASTSTSDGVGTAALNSVGNCISTSALGDMQSTDSSISASSDIRTSAVGTTTSNGDADLLLMLSSTAALPPSTLTEGGTGSIPLMEGVLGSIPAAGGMTGSPGIAESSTMKAHSSSAHLVNCISSASDTPIPSLPIMNSLPSSEYLTVVSINSKLYICNLSSNPNATSIQPITTAVGALNDFKNSRKTTKSQTPVARGQGSSVVRVPSDDAVAGSVCLKRKRCGAPSTPHALSFSISTMAGRTWKSHDLKEAWTSVLSELQEQRSKLDLPFVPFNRESSYKQFGLTHPLVIQLLEQLPHASRCSNYTFSYHKPSEMTSWRAHRPLRNLSGCSRTEKFDGKRSPRDMFSFLMSDLRPVRPNLDLMALEYAVVSADSTTGAKIQTASDLPMAMRYRSLQKTYKQHVGVFQSDIHGLGLYCTRDIDPGEMVIEYAGTVIRSVLTDKREKLYDSKGIGCYMFRIDADEVVDATMSGNEARFINHACEPNCYSKVITVDGNKKIMIFALRRIVPGEELTYDYKFPKEEAKIPCNCGSKRCRKTMN